MMTYTIVAGGVTTQYDQKMVRVMSRSNASPEATCVIWASVNAGGEETTKTLATTNTGSSNALCQPNLVDAAINGNNTNGVMNILDRTVIATVFVSPGVTGSERFATGWIRDLFLSMKRPLTLSTSESADLEVDIAFPLRSSLLMGGV